MALQPANSGQLWSEVPDSGAAVAVVGAGLIYDAPTDAYLPSITGPFKGAVLDIVGDGNYKVTDISAGYPAYVAELGIYYLNGDFYCTE